MSESNKDPWKRIAYIAVAASIIRSTACGRIGVKLKHMPQPLPTAKSNTVCHSNRKLGTGCRRKSTNLCGYRVTWEGLSRPMQTFIRIFGVFIGILFVFSFSLFILFHIYKHYGVW